MRGWWLGGEEAREGGGRESVEGDWRRDRVRKGRGKEETVWEVV